jgi:hypothetical protein
MIDELKLDVITPVTWVFRLCERPPNRMIYARINVWIINEYNTVTLDEFVQVDKEKDKFYFILTLHIRVYDWETCPKLSLFFVCCFFLSQYSRQVKIDIWTTMNLICVYADFFVTLEKKTIKHAWMHVVAAGISKQAKNVCKSAQVKTIEFLSFILLNFTNLINLLFTNFLFSFYLSIIFP